MGGKKIPGDLAAGKRAFSACARVDLKRGKFLENGKPDAVLRTLTRRGGNCPNKNFLKRSVRGAGGIPRRQSCLVCEREVTQTTLKPGNLGRTEGKATVRAWRDINSFIG